MIAVILAAGKGSRLNEYTKNTPKSLLPLNSRTTLLDYNLDVLEKLGVSKTFIVTGFAHTMIEAHVKNMNIECIYNPFWNQCNVLGSLFMALPFLKEDFLFLHADTLVDLSVWNQLKEHSGRIVLPYKGKECGDEEMKVRHDQSGKLVEISKEIEHHLADGEFLGIAKFSSEMIPYISEKAKGLFSTGRLNQYMEEVVQSAIDDSIEIETFEIGDAKFVEVDFEADYINAKENFG